MNCVDSLHAIVILVAGIGSRLFPLTQNTPKALIEVKGRTFLERALLNLPNKKSEQTVLVTGYLHEKIEQFVQQKQFSVKNIFNPKFAEANNAYSLSVALEVVRPKTLTLLDGDLLLSPPVFQKLFQWNQSLDDNFMLVDDEPQRITAEAMKVSLECGQVKRIGKNIPIHEAQGEFIGALHLNSEWTQALSQKLPKMMADSRYHSCYYEDVIGELLPNFSSINSVSVKTSDWFEVDTIEDLEEAKKLAWL